MEFLTKREVVKALEVPNSEEMIDLIDSINLRIREAYDEGFDTGYSQAMVDAEIERLSS